MKNRLDQDFTLGGLLYFALPTTIMMLVTSLYTIVDGVLTSRLVGENALAAINIAYPAISAMLAMGIMLGTKAFVAAVLGGIGSIPGAVIGGLLVGFAEVFVSAMGFSVWRDAVVFLLLIIVLIVKPTGILGRTMNEKV